jgi:hypothetical protein
MRMRELVGYGPFMLNNYGRDIFTVSCVACVPDSFSRGNLVQE